MAGAQSRTKNNTPSRCWTSDSAGGFELLESRRFGLAAASESDDQESACLRISSSWLGSIASRKDCLAEMYPQGVINKAKDRDIYSIAFRECVLVNTFSLAPSFAPTDGSEYLGAHPITTSCSSAQ